MALRTIVAAYDVAADQRRARLAALLQAHGDRIQKSVFVLVVPDDDLADLENRIRQRIDPDEDSVYLIRLCKPCWTEVECIGQAHRPEAELYWAVL